MVDLALLQSVSYIAGALGVCVAAFYYVMNLRVQQENTKHTQKAREMDACKFLTDRMTSEHSMSSYALIMTGLQWNDPKEFMEKYGYSNTEIFGKWTSWLFLGETLGYQIRNQIVSAETIYDLGGWGFIRVWERFKPIILMRRETAWGRDEYSSFEFFAGEMLRIKNERDAMFNDLLDGYKTNWKMQ